jgi:putative glutamine amidotransferase
MGTTAMDVNSVHHQATDRLGDGLRAVAWAEDGVVEAIEHDSEPVLAVQWHPEWTASVDWQRQRRLFEALVAPA